MPKSDFKKPRKDGEIADYFSIMYSLFREECAKYDEGDPRYILNIVGKLYILLEDSGKQQSLLRLLGIRGELNFPDSASLYDGNPTSLPMADIYVSPLTTDRMVFRAKLDSCNAAPRLSYGKWWYRDVYFLNEESRLSRSELVGIMRSQDGHGGHFDSALRSETYEFFRSKGLPEFCWYFAGNERVLEIKGKKIYIVSEIPKIGDRPPLVTTGPFPVFLGPQATVRQIAWELDTALLNAGVLSEFGIL